MKWRRFFGRKERDAELAKQIAFHFEAETEENLARGMAPEAARLAARRKLGNPTLIREEVRGMSSIPYLETIWQDVRYSLRGLRKSPVFTATAILTLTLGIGANTAIFTVIRAVLLKPLEYQDPDRLAYLSLDSPQNTPNTQDIPFTGLRVEATRAARSFSAVGAHLRTAENMTLAGDGDPEVLKGARVSANFLDVLGIRPRAGRSFRPEEEKPGAPAVAMISSTLWKRRFGGDPQVFRRTVTIDATPYTIIGVLPDGFVFPFSADIWVTKPTEWSSIPSRAWTVVTTQIVFARLNAGVSLEQARAEMEVINRRYMLAEPARGDARPGTVVRVEWLKDRIVSKVRLMLWLIFGAVGLVLLIACGNLASLLLARASSRFREFAVRAALGASRARLMGQLICESLVLSLAGGTFGVLLAKWSLTALQKAGPVALPRVGEIQVDGLVLGFTVVLSIFTGVLFGSFPSLVVSHPNLADALRESGAAAGRASGRSRGFFAVSPRGLLVVGQIAFSIVLLIGAVLLLQSFVHLRSVDPGFQQTNLLTMKIPLPPSRYDARNKRAAFYEELQQRIQSLPGVQSAAIVRSIPTTPWFWTNVTVAGRPEAAAREQPSAQLQSVTPGYFRTMRIPIRRGREFLPSDNAPGAPPVFLINETLARRFWPAYPEGLNPVGQHMGEGYDKIASGEIVGIVGDVLESGFGGKPGPEFYLPLAVHAPQSAYVVARTPSDPARLANAIQNAVLSVDRDQPVSDIRTMEDVFDATLGQRRLTMWLLGGFAGIALVLAVVGIYGVIAYSVAQRTQEMGIRRALGAGRGDILRLILRQGLGLTTAGVILGLVGAFVITRVMKTLLFQVSTTDPVAFAGTALVYVLVALVASFIPAWRATRIDPTIAFRVG